jgi:hypothetical protein
MKFIVLGAAGRMGQMHARHLRDLGHEVVKYDVGGPLPTEDTGNEDWWTEPADGVVIATPAELHAEHLMKAIKHDYHVFIEKPICLIDHLSDAKRAVQHAMEKRLVVSVGYNLRFHPLVKNIKRRINQGFLRPQLATFMLRQNPSRRLNHFLEEWASHEVDLAMHLLGHWADAKLIRNATDWDFRELQLMLNHGTATSLILADAYTVPFVRSFTIIDQRGRSLTHDIERDHVQPVHYRDEIAEWIRLCQLATNVTYSVYNFASGHSPLAIGVDGLAVIDLLQRMTVKNGHRKSQFDRARADA